MPRRKKNSAKDPGTKQMRDIIDVDCIAVNCREVCLKWKPNDSEVSQDTKSMIMLKNVTKKGSKVEKIVVHSPCGYCPLKDLLPGNMYKVVVINYSGSETGSGPPGSACTTGSRPRTGSVCTTASVSSTESETTTESGSRTGSASSTGSETTEGSEVIGSGLIQFTACLTPNELAQLYMLAVAFDGDARWKKIDCFYRNKPEAYYNKVRSSTTKVEAAYMKDKNGDPGNPINDKIKGLFFNGITGSNGKPTTVSPFGKIRLTVSANLLVHEGTRLYFSDFYCNSAVQQHYVTVVAANPGTVQDNFCRKRLPMLNPRDNPFLQIAEDGSVLLNHSKQLRVELFYTGDVDTKKGHFTSTAVFGRGHSLKSGIPKRRTCQHCNLRYTSSTSL